MSDAALGRIDFARHQRSLGRMAGRDCRLTFERVCGTQLDPALADTFRKLCSSGPEWMLRFKIRREKAA